VLRKSIGNQIRIFNQYSGEYLASIVDEGRILAQQQLRQLKLSTAEKQISIAFGIIKPERFAIIVDMCTQLGVSNFFPIVTDYTQIRKINIERYQKIIIESSEQSERLSIPTIHEPQTLTSLLKSNPDASYLWGRVRTEQQISKFINHEEWHTIILVGPEGGFSQTECTIISSAQNSYPICLSNNILRTETACIAILSFYLCARHNECFCF
jgi:16S rRNA (uracil1498-N3)-methyltransferase